MTDLDLAFPGSRAYTFHPYTPGPTKTRVLCEILHPTLNTPSRRLLHAQLSHAGLWPDDCRFTELTQTDDGRWVGGANRRALSPFLLLVGGAGVRWWRADLTVGRTRGSCYRIGTAQSSFALFPVTHPETILAGKNPGVRDDARVDFARWADVCKGVSGPLEHMRAMCVGCDGARGGVDVREADWVPWCRGCWVDLEAARRDKDLKARTYKLRDAKGKIVDRTVLSEDQTQLEV